MAPPKAIAAHPRKTLPDFVHQQGTARGKPAICETICVPEDESTNLEHCAPSHAHLWVRHLES